MQEVQFKGVTVLITGASSGIGRAFASRLAARGANLILTARCADRLEQTADALKIQYGTSIQWYPADLREPDTPRRLVDLIKTSGASVDVLINNAGFGKWAHFLAEDLATYQQMLSVNINALVSLTHLCLPEMLARGQGGVINVASTAAFQPVPYVAVYSASKSFVLHFTEALAGEYGEFGLRFLALCPGNTATNFPSVANADTSGMSSAAPEDVVDAALAAYSHSRSYHVSGLANYLVSLLPRFAPRSATIRIVANMFRERVAPFAV
jgi:short-subunit dehydrogenase